ncbi:hypothetical protein [Dysgonomonas termitidis]|uniref:DUF2750 domain-containing protein n=1 Tax=Dysgonomonas termitidis TaxID=1516126 RepID=A0ABV9KTA6_9BACT
MKYHIENECKLPELRTEMDSLYEAYKKENGKEPLYAIVWLENRICYDLQWPATVKLVQEVDEKEDEQIYMNFDGYADLKKWLYSTLEEDSDSEDIWRYENTEYRIEFMDRLLIDD